MGYGLWFGIFVFLGTTLCQGQNREEREHRIRKSQFPSVQLDSLVVGSEIKQKRYYKEIDSLQTTYIFKFKKDRLHYFLSYDDTGKLVTSGFRIKEIDMPEETYQKIESYLSDSYKKYRIKRIFQEYPAVHTESDTPKLRNTFQNLILPNIVYKLIVIGKNNKRSNDLDLWFRADGSLIRKRLALPMNHDRILY